jgi:hypothetical protein
MAIAIALAAATPAAAQIRGLDVPAGRIEVGGGGGWLGGAGLGPQDANLRAASVTPTPFRLFSTDSHLAAAPTFHVEAGFALNPRFGVEGRFTLSHPELRTSVGDDVESAPPITVAERIDQYSVDASLVVMIRELAMGRRTVPFVSAGAGYLRQLHAGQTVVEQGHVFHAGGGVKHFFLVRRQARINGAGVRGDAHLYLMSGAIAVEDDPRPHGAISGSVFVTF